MFAATLKRYLEIAKENVKHNFLPQFVLAVLILILTPVIFGITGLDAKASAVPLEMFVSLIGVILLTPIFAAEQNEEIRETVESKYTSFITVYLIRILIFVITIALLISLFILIMRWYGCDVSFKMALGTFASALFLGAIGFTSYGISNNIAVGYMLPILYYSLNYTGGSIYLGKFYLFSMMKSSYNEKLWLFMSGILMLLFTIVWKLLMHKKK